MCVCVYVRVFVCVGSLWGRGSSVHVVIVNCVGIECTGVVWCCQYWRFSVPVHCSVNTNLPPLLVRPKLTLYVNKGSDACE